MDAGRRKIRFCILTAVLTAVVLGAFYYVFEEEEIKPNATDVLVRWDGTLRGEDRLIHTVPESEDTETFVMRSAQEEKTELSADKKSTDGVVL